MPWTKGPLGDGYCGSQQFTGALFVMPAIRPMPPIGRAEEFAARTTENRTAIPDRGARLAARMKLLVHRSKVFSVDMCIDLRGRDVRMSEHLLHGPQVSPSLQQVRGEGMP